MNSYNGFSPAQRMKAQRWLNEQWDSGALPRPSKCCACGQTKGIIHAHAEDYSEPFGDHTHAYHLCYRCHITLHCRFRNRAAWNRYKQLLRDGWNWQPIYGNNFPAIEQFMAGGGHPDTQGEPRPSLVFDEMGL